MGSMGASAIFSHLALDYFMLKKTYSIKFIKISNLLFNINSLKSTRK